MAEAVINEFETVGFVDLAPVTDPALVIGACARLLQVRETPDQPLPEALAAALRERTTLLILDNLEQVPAGAPVVEALVAANPGLTVLATSREPLHLRREQVVEVTSLAVPEVRRTPWRVVDLAEVPGVALFVERAQAADASFTLSEANASAVAELSRQLDGLPLALELAAARTRLLDPAALLTRVEHGLALLRWDAPDLPARQRTLRATLDWSYTLLTPEEQTVFRRLGVFAGSFTLEAMSAVVATTELGIEPLELLTSLVDKHLVRVLERAPGNDLTETRFALLATMREYAREQLAAREELEVTRHRHLTHSLTLAQQTAEARQGPGEAAWLVWLAAEEADLRQALEWAVITGNIEAELDLIVVLWELWASQGALREGVARVEEALGRAGESERAPVAWLYQAAGMFAGWLGEDDRATHLFERGLAVALRVGDSARAAHILGQLAGVAYARGDGESARALAAQMLALARTDEGQQTMGHAYLVAALFAVGPLGSLHDRQALQAELDEPVAVLRAASNHRILALLLAARARLLADADPEAALAALRESLTVVRGLHDVVMMSVVPWMAAVLLAKRLEAERGARLIAAATALAARAAAIGGRSAIAVYGAPVDRALLARTWAAARAVLGEERFAAAEAAGSALTFDEVLDEAIAALDVVEAGAAVAAEVSAQSEHVLSPREREVLALVAEGRSNKEIAAALFVSLNTVKTHVTSLLTKLDAENRAQLAVLATEQRLHHPSPATPR